MTGIYKIDSKINPTRCYIGSAIDIRDRWRCHLKDLKKNKHSNPKLQNHYNKYGGQDLVFNILELCFPEFLTAREQYYINKLRPWFNICFIAGSTLGKKHSEETKKKLSESHKGKITWNKGKHWSEEIRKKLSNALKGKYLSKETRQKISESLKGEKHPLFGKHHSEEAKKKMSKSHKGNKNNLGHKHSEETRKKMSIAAKLYKRKLHSEETKFKMSESAKKRWAFKKIA